MVILVWTVVLLVTVPAVFFTALRLLARRFEPARYEETGLWRGISFADRPIDEQDLPHWDASKQIRNQVI